MFSCSTFPAIQPTKWLSYRRDSVHRPLWALLRRLLFAYETLKLVSIFFWIEIFSPTSTIYAHTRRCWCYPVPSRAFAMWKLLIGPWFLDISSDLGATILDVWFNPSPLGLVFGIIKFWFFLKYFYFLYYFLIVIKF